MSAIGHHPVSFLALSAALSVALPDAGLAQDIAAESAAEAAPVEEESIVFSADEISYDEELDLVSATGHVRANRDGYFLAADQIVWDLKTGEIVAGGNVVVMSPTGDRLVAERTILNEELTAGTSESLLLALTTGGRIAASMAERHDGKLELENVVYSACAVVNDEGCPQNPSWKITAARAIRDEENGTIRFVDGRLHIFSLSIPLLPMFAFGDSSRTGGVTGALVPQITISGKNGFEVELPYYWRLGPNRDLTLTPHIYTGAIPAIEAEYRQLTDHGAFQIGGFATYAEVDNPDPDVITTSKKEDFRGYFEANGRFQLDPYWRVTANSRIATDKTITRRYDITRDDRLRNFLMTERISRNGYISIAGWAFQGLRVDDEQKEIPIALPAIDARFRIDDPIAGGQLEVQANSLAILRIDGQDTQRAFAGVRWDRRMLTGLGQELTLTGYARADAYHTENAEETPIALYAGENGWHFRGIGALAADIKWPLVGGIFGGTQRLTPRVQLVVSPPTPNLNIPNEDARAIDLEDSNLFALNRFPGYDRWEDGSRLTYGVEWKFDRPNFSIQSNIGQSYRFNRAPSIFPDGTGLTDRFSDFVGRTRLRFGRLIDFTQRFRLDKDTFAIRRNEVDLTFGTIETYAQVNYLRLNRNISTDLEDLRDKEELRLAGRLKFANYWSLFGATVLDLTGTDEDPLSLADGFEPARHRIGINYEDDCIELGLSWRRDYERVGDFRKGSTFQIRFNLKGLGR